MGCRPKSKLWIIFCWSIFWAKIPDHPHLLLPTNQPINQSTSWEYPNYWGSQLYQWWDGTVFTHKSRMTFIESNASFLHLGGQLQSSWTTTLQGMDHCIQEPWRQPVVWIRPVGPIYESYGQEFGRAWNCPKKNTHIKLLLIKITKELVKKGEWWKSSRPNFGGIHNSVLSSRTRDFISLGPTKRVAHAGMA